MRQLYYKETKILFNGVEHDFCLPKLRYGEKPDNHIEKFRTFEDAVVWAEEIGSRCEVPKHSFLKKIIAKVNEWPDDRLKITKRNFKSLEYREIYKPADCQYYTIVELSEKLPANQYMQYYIDHIPEVKGNENDVGVLQLPNV